MTTRQMNVAQEHIARIVDTVTRVAIAVRPPLIGAIPRVRVTACVAVIRTRAAPELPRVVIATALAVAEISSIAGLLPVVIAVALARIIVAIAWVVAPARVVKHLEPPQVLKLR